MRVRTDIRGVTTTAARRQNPPLLHYSPWLLFALCLVGVGVYIDPLIALGLGVIEVMTGAGFGVAQRVSRGGAEITARLVTSHRKLADEALNEVIADLLWGVRSLDEGAWSEQWAEQLMSLYNESMALTAANPQYRPVHQAAASLLLAHLVRRREEARPGPKGGTEAEWRTVCDEIRDEVRQIAAALPEGDAIRQTVEQRLTAPVQMAALSAA